MSRFANGVSAGAFARAVVGLACIGSVVACVDVRAPHHDGNSSDSDEHTASASGHDYCVSPEGDDARSGHCPAESWRSIERVNRQNLQPADRVLFEAGFRYEGTLRLGRDDAGSALAPVRVSSFGHGRATLHAGNASGIEISDVAGFVIEHLIVEGDWDAATQSGNQGEGVVATRSVIGSRARFLRLRDLDIHGFKLAGIGLHAVPSDDSKGAGFEDVEISDCDVHDNADFGITSDGPFSDERGYSHASIRILRVRSHTNRGLMHKGAHTGSGIVLSDVDDALIEHSIAYDNGEFNDHPGGGGFGIWAWDANRVLIQHNESYENKTSTADGGGFDLDGGVTQSIVQYNYSHDNAGAGYGAFQFAYARPYSGNVIRYNISQNDAPAFLVWDGNGDMGSLAVLQNAGYGAAPALVTYSAFADVTLLNNIFYGVGPTLLDVYDAAGLTLQGNDYYAGGRALQIAWNTGTAAPVTYTSFDAFQTATGNELLDGAPSGQALDPGWVAAGSGPTLGDTSLLGTLSMYELPANSPLIDRGVDPERFGIEAGDRDFFARHTPLGDAPDVGAYEAR
jgi:hypothetical protein